MNLIYANLAAEKAAIEARAKGEIPISQVEMNLNIAFPGKIDGNIEERTAYHLREHLGECHFVLDTHSTSVDYGEFVVSTSGLTIDMVRDAHEGKPVSAVTRLAYEGSGLHYAERMATNIDAITSLAINTGLLRHVQMSDAVASGRSLIEFVNAHGNGYAISFEAGQHEGSNTNQVAMAVAQNILRAYRVIEGEPVRVGRQEIYLGRMAVQLPEGVEGFRITDEVENFKLLPAGTPYAYDGDGQSYSLDREVVPVLFDERKRKTGEFRSGRVFIATERIS